MLALHRSEQNGAGCSLQRCQLNRSPKQDCRFSSPFCCFYYTSWPTQIMPGQSLPYFTRGKVSKGFGRGSKELGCPTANFPEDTINNIPDDLATGVYYGFGQVNGGEVHKMVMSIGWNPFYQNKKKSMEVHLLHKFEQDFYDQELRIVVLGYLRPEKNFDSLDALIKAIDDDINQAKAILDQPEHAVFTNNPFFS